MVQKRYTAFISSAFESLRDERNTVINCLLDFRVMPIGMEHFTVAANDQFSAIQELIDESDFFILLMGRRYGSLDENGVSWTQREYEYAKFKNKPMVVIICDELLKSMAQNPDELTEDERRQVEFRRTIEYARSVSSDLDIRTIIMQFFNTYDFSKCIGWTRLETISQNEGALRKWREAHRVFDLAGNWHHVHLSEEDYNYIRIGTIRIEQTFIPEKYKTLHISEKNYSVAFYDEAQSVLRENKMKCSRFNGEYDLHENGEIFGIFFARRMFEEKFGETGVGKGQRRGIHDFTIDIYNERTDRIEGEFHDEAPSPKLGRIFIFRDIAERNQFLLEMRGDIIERK